MYTIQVTGDLVLEVHPGREPDRSLVVLQSLGLKRDAEPPGGVVIWAIEIHSLIEALGDAAEMLASEGRRHRD